MSTYRDQADEIATLRQELEAVKEELARWTSGRRRKGMPVIESVPDGLQYAAALARSIGTEGGEDHDRLLSEACQRMKGLHDAAAALIVERDAMRPVVEAAKAFRLAIHDAAEDDDWDDEPWPTLIHSIVLAVDALDDVVSAPLINAAASGTWRPARPGDTPGQMLPELEARLTDAEHDRDLYGPVLDERDRLRAAATHLVQLVDHGADAVAIGGAIPALRRALDGGGQ